RHARVGLSSVGRIFRRTRRRPLAPGPRRMIQGGLESFHDLRSYLKGVGQQPQEEASVAQRPLSPQPAAVTGFWPLAPSGITQVPPATSVATSGSTGQIPP